MPARGLPLITPRLTLRPALPSDAKALHAVYGDPQVMRYWDSPPDPDLPTTQARVLSIAGSEPQTYLVIDKSGTAIGTAGVHQDCEIGFILGRAHWRQGLMTEALNALIPWLFETQDYPHLTADADPLNTASLATLGALGFRETGRAARTFCVDGVWSDSVYFALQRPS